VLDAIAVQVLVKNPCLVLLALANVDPDHLRSGEIPIAQSGFDLNNERFLTLPCSETRWRMPHDIERRLTRRVDDQFLHSDSVYPRMPP
jgi:hypothetical protein